MKHLTLTLATAFIFLTSYAQDTTRIVIGGKTIMVIENNGKGNEEINVDVMLDSISKRMDTTEIEIEVEEEEYKKEKLRELFKEGFEEGFEDAMEKEIEEEIKIKNNGDKSIAHWAGFEAGVNGWMDNNMSLNMENPAYELDYSKSLFTNLNIVEQKLPFFKGYAGLVTGLGFNFNSFAFKGNTSLGFNQDSTWANMNNNVNFSKNKLNVTYLTLPLMLEFNTSLHQDKSFHFAFGVQGGFKLLGKTKQKYEQGNERYKTNVRGHYNINPWKADAVARVGYKNMTLFANYPLTQFFEEGAGPEIYTWQIGLRIIDFD